MLAFLVAFKSYSPDNYLALRQNMSYTELINFIEFVKKGFDMADHYDFRVMTRIHANLIVDYLDRYKDSRDYDQAIKDLQTNFGEDAPSESKVYSIQVLQYIQKAEFEGQYRGLKFTLSRLDLIESLTVNK